MLLYLHIPFCNRKCPYCSFNSYVGRGHLWQEYLEKVLEEFRWHQSQRPTTFETLYIGGGTPSTLPVPFFEQFFEEVGPFLKPGGERTIEVNPTVSFQWLKGVAPYFTRISIGVQSFNREKLHFLGRFQTPEEGIKSVERAKDVGFQEISIDFIYRTALDTRQLLERDLEIALSLPITHLSCYSLTLEEGTRFAGRRELLSSDEGLELWFLERVRERFPQYEVSNFGTPSLHNLGYWELKEYRGLGAGGVGFERRGGRFYRYYHNLKVENYLSNPLPVEWEEIGNRELRVEKLFLGLRSVVGVDPALLIPPQLERALQLVEEGFLSWGVSKTGRGSAVSLPISSPLSPPLRLFASNFLLADQLTVTILE
ncbi:MAG: radical SAM family heme chaperone HemW [Campylobacterales bacterium]